jgi:AraC-like DNA-binding protein
LANLFNISKATLRRRLEQENTSISDIKDSCRCNLAYELLQHPDLTLEEIADRLCFSNASSFRRAFSSWTGITPTDYRQTLLSISDKESTHSAVQISGATS